MLLTVRLNDGCDLKRKKSRAAAWVGVLVICVAGLLMTARPVSPLPRPALSLTKLHQIVLKFVREQYGIPDTVQLTAGPLESAQDSAYYECMITVQNGAKTTTQPISISKDGRYLAMTPLYYLGANPQTAIASAMREAFKLGSEWRLRVGPFRASLVPGFYKTTVKAVDNGQQRTGEFYVTEDKKFVVLGPVYVVRSDSENERLINTRNQPSSGPPNAPVTIVEYADLECPSCARLQPFLENQVLPRYGNKVRIIYKDYPLPMHPWGRIAAVASQCAYEIDPSAVVRFRSSIFAEQDQINVTNVRDSLLRLGEQAGIDRLKLAACMDSNASLPRVEADVREGDLLQVTSTPTSFINGRIVVGLQSPAEFYKLIDRALAQDK
ncbi:MAG TPA: thioredoxin domain-containing protein [Terriglobia bacterium]|nr:thioredoxin domain-containing protein [Terriglobia bacterium]